MTMHGADALISATRPTLTPRSEGTKPKDRSTAETPILSIRPFPFAYRAGLAIANGVQGCTSAAFRLIFDYVCGTGETPFGPGLGLELGFAFTLHPVTGRMTFGIPLPSQRTAPSPGEPAIIESCIRSGWIDTIRDVGAGDRAERTIEAVFRSGVRPSVAINVGCACLGVDFHSDDTLLESHKFTHDSRNFRVGDDRSLLGAFGRQNRADFDFTENAEALRWQSTTLQPFDLDRTTFGFKRFRGELRPTSTTFPSQVTSSRLDALESERGAVIVEQNLALWSLIGAANEVDGLRCAEQDVFDFHNRLAWADISTRVRAGRLLFCTVSRLLRWLQLRASIVYTTESRNGAGWTIHIHGQRRGTTVVPLTPAELDGLAFLVPETAPDVTVVLGANERKIDVLRKPDPVFPPAHAVFIPWSPLERPHLADLAGPSV